MNARPCLTCGAAVRCRGNFVLCAACWSVARAVCRRAYDALPEGERGPTAWQRFSNDRMTDLDWLVAAITGERASVAGAA